jgi:hypothetical protein
MELSKNQRHKLDRYGILPRYSAAELLFRIEVNEVRKRIYRKPYFKESERKKLVAITVS